MAPLLQAQNNRLSTDHSDQFPTMYSDITKFRQIITNLLSNANKFTENGVITLAGHYDDTDKLVTITVSDTGIGMTDEQIKRIFEAFEQAETSTSIKYGGTGLGLSLCREFAEMLGGSITASSKPGQGSTFTVRLPANQESNPANA